MKYDVISLLHSLRFRLIAVVVAIEVVMLSLLVWSNILIIHTTHADRLRDTSGSIIQQIADTSGNYIVAVDYAALREYLHNVLKHRELSYLVILDRDEHAVVSVGEVPGVQWPLIDSHPLQVDDGVYDSTHTIQVAGQPMGRVLMGFSLAFMEDAIRKSRVRGISIALMEILLTVVATILVGLRLTRRLGSLSDAAAAVAAGNYTVVVPTETADEVGKTATAFNRMISEVSNRTRQLEQSEEKATRLLAENRQLVHASLKVQEEERRHLSRELHDELGQSMTAIQADAELVRELSRGREPRIEASANAILDVSSDMYAVVHSMMQRLRPGVLDDMGLVAAIEEEVKAWQGRHPDIKCAFSCREEPPGLGEQAKINLFRIVQESLTNIAKYADASRVDIRLNVRALHENTAALYLEVKDDGCGMDPGEPRHGLGLLGMRERMEAMNGHLIIQSRPGEGMKIQASIPMQEAGS